MMLNVVTAARASTLLVCMGLVIGSLELIWTRSQFRAGRIHDWAVLRTVYPWAVCGRRASLATMLFRYPSVLILLSMELLLALLLIANPLPDWSWLSAGLLCVIVALEHLRSPYGLDGSDQMQVVVLGGLFVFYAAPNDLIRQAALWFIAAEAMLAYFTSGYAKLISPI